MRVDQSTAVARSDRTDDVVAAQTSFDQHLQTVRDRRAAPGSCPANDNTSAVTVKRGDTLIDIASRHDVCMKDLYRANPQFDPHRQDGILHFDRTRHGGWDPDYIRPGDRINLPSTTKPCPEPPSSQPRRKPPDVPGTPTPNPNPQNTPSNPNPSNPSATPAPSGPSASGTPNAPTPPSPSAGPSTATPSPTQNPPNPSNPSATPTPIVPITPSSQVLKGGVGIEAAAKASSRPTFGGEPYVKGSIALGSHWNINGKIKYTPRGKLTVTTFDPNGKTAADPNASPSSKSSLRQRLKAALPEKLTVDAGLVFNKRVEGGGSLEIKFNKGVKLTPSAYLSKKDPTNVLVDSAQLKLGKLNPVKVGGALVNGTRDTLAQSRSEAKANGGRWSPLRQQFWKAVNNGEVTISGEKAYVNPHGPVSGFVNFAGKTTLKDIGQGLEPPVTASGLTRFTGFAAGTGASFLGAGLTDQLIGNEIGNRELRRAVDGFGGAMSGLVVDSVAQKTVPVIASKVAPALSRLAAPVTSRAAPLLADAAPVLSKVGEVASKIPLGDTGRVLSKVARIGGPAGALIAGIPDGVDAFKSFQKGDAADGWKSVGRGVMRVGCTAAGAAIGQALIPIPGVGAAVGAVAGGFVGDLVAKLF